MFKIRYKLIFALIFSPMLANTGIAKEEPVETVAQKIERIKSDEQQQQQTPQIDPNLNTQSSLPEKLVTEVQAAASDLTIESQELKQQLQMSKKNPSSSDVQKTNDPLSKLKNMETFKVCSLGHNYNISNFEFIKVQQIKQSGTLLKYKSQEDVKYNCEMKIKSEQDQMVTLQCWKGLKTNINLSIFTLSYFVGDGYLFMQPEKNRLVLVKPVHLGEAHHCPKNYKPIVRSKKKLKSPVEENPSGLAGLTF